MPTINPMPMLSLSIEAAKAANQSFEDTIKDLPADKQAVLRALRQIAFEGRSQSMQRTTPADSADCFGAGVIGFLLGSAL